ncbi:hypothetical protein C8A03DRAFT_36159 [Achaetomium macrosporum]|uniref:Rhodopsin domain-containing protein n=1 Tax=Achaetomium macrosporum TaxID=79813 RepID=A0AAN7C728_9PEZI|nr:hypothetical protein C8A03DRAFT_36159 [Achaetomium macrosporum]
MDPIPETPAIGPDTDRRLSLEAAVWTMVAITGVVMALRMWARTFTHMMGHDDLHMALCWVTFVALAVISTLIAESGGTRHFAYLTLEEKQHQVKLQIVLEMFGIPCTAFGKVAVAFTILRIVKQSSTKWYAWSLWALIWLTAITTALDVLLVLFRCGDPTHLWDLVGQATGVFSCLDAQAVYDYNTFAAAFQAFADFFLALLPVHIIWGLQMPAGRKLALIALLGLSTFTGIAASVKTSLAAELLGHSADPTWGLYALGIWAAVEITLIVICGSVPALVPLWERLVGRRRRGYANASAPYVVSSDYYYSSASGRGSKFKPGSKGQSSSRTMVTTAASVGGGTVLYPEDDAMGRPGAMSTAGKFQEDRDRDDVELARLTETHGRGFAYLSSESSRGGFH